MYYVYLHSPCGTELIGKGTKLECELIVEKKQETWKPGDMWSTEITNKEKKETNYWD